MASLSTNTCNTATQIRASGGRVINNPDGTISVFVPDNVYGLKPVALDLQCCNVLGISGAYFDIDSQKCRWTTSNSGGTCSIESAFKLVLNPKGNDGSIFYVDGEEECYLTIDFDYLIKLDCKTLANIGNPSSNTSGLTSSNGFVYLPLTSPTLNRGLIISNNVAMAQQVNNQLTALNTQLLTTNYSIAVPAPPTTPTNIVPITNAPFQNTGFGGGLATTAPLQPQNTSALPLIAESGFDLTNSGLVAWKGILGLTNYNNFLAGDPTSYTYTHVQQLHALNQSSSVPLINASSTPFGARTALLNNITNLNTVVGPANPNAFIGSSTVGPSNPNTLIGTVSPTNRNAFIGNTIPLNPNTLIGVGPVSPLIPNLIPITNIVTVSACSTPIEALELFDTSMTIDVYNTTISGTNVTTVFEGPVFQQIGLGNLYSYLTTSSGHSGFYICGDPVSGDPTNLTSCTTLTLNPSNGNVNVSSCNQLNALLFNEIFSESGLPNTANGVKTFNSKVGHDAFNSDWLHFSSIIKDPNIISQIINKNIKISLKINSTCVAFCLLVDNIVMNKVCSDTKTDLLRITKSPGFKLDRIRDNKKSWINNTTPVDREFDITRNDGSHPIRITGYDVNDERLVINTKEIDLDISLASGIETDVWCYMVNNECMLTGCTIASSCGCATLGTGATATYSPIWSPSGWVGTINVTMSFNFLPNFTLFGLTGNVATAMVAFANYINTNAPYSNDLLASWNGTSLILQAKVLSALTNSWVANFSTSSGILISNPTFGFSGGADGQPETICCGDDCIDYTTLLTQSVTGITVIEQFEDLMTSELIDAKDRKTLSAYPTLRAVYDRYMDNGGRCSVNSGRFDYETMDQFANLVGNYWVDIVEQVVPATTIWGSTRIYSNTIFDQQKFRYKPYTLLLGGNPYSGATVPSPVSVCASGVSAVTTTVTTGTPITTYYTEVCIAQMNSGSEFIGTVGIISNTFSPHIWTNLANPNYQIIAAP